MDNTERPNDDARTLRSLLKDAGYTSSRMGSERRAMYFPGRTREWNLVARLKGGWFNIYTCVCTIPAEPGLRARLFEAVMTLNQRMPVAKFVTGGDWLVLELDYRAEHLTVEVLRNLTSLLHDNAEEHYPKVFRIVSGDEVLESIGNLPAAEAA